MNGPQYHWKRRAVQFFTLLLFALIPAIGLFRIDLTTASFSILGHQIGWSNFTLVAGLAIIVVTVPIITYKTIGSMWCGWACPQNLLAEFANKLTRKLLGKRATVDVKSAGMNVSSAKNKLVNWILLVASFLAASLVLAFLPFLYFYSPSEVIAFVTSSNAKLSVFMRQLYFFTVFLVFIDIAVIRYFWCDYFCLYRIGQKVFNSRHALHVSYDESRSADCTKCNYCATSCITGIQPTHISRYDSCVNCGECIDACTRLHDKTGTSGLLRYDLGAGGKLRSIVARFSWISFALFLIGVVMVGWGLHNLPKPVPVATPAEQKAMQALQRECNLRCAPERKACSGKNMSACYSLAACECSCNLDHDPTNPLQNEWRQCIRVNNEKAAKPLP